jgi:hypothetical protein
VRLGARINQDVEKSLYFSTYIPFACRTWPAKKPHKQKMKESTAAFLLLNFLSPKIFSLTGFTAWGRAAAKYPFAIVCFCPVEFINKIDN